MSSYAVRLTRLARKNTWPGTRLCSSSSYGSDSITYSGGHASQGQGGFYGSGGSRLVKGEQKFAPEFRASKDDIVSLQNVMSDVDSLELQLAKHGDVVNSTTIELKSKIKKTLHTPKVRALLNRLEIKGEPVWGLSISERELVKAAKAKYLS